MTTKRIRGVWVALTLLTAPVPLLMLGCGGNATAPTTPPTYNPAPVVIIGGVTSSAISAPVTLTFTFSEPVSAFPASAVTVTNGTAAASTTMINANQYTLKVTPPASASGTMTVSVAAGAFTDTAGVASTTAASVTQLYNTVVKVSSYVVEDFNTALPSGEAYNTTDFNGDVAALTSTGVPAGAPAGTGPVVVKIAAPAVSGGAVYNGTFMGVGYENSVGALPFYATGASTPQATKMSVVLYSPVAGVDIKLKLQNAADGTKSVETDQTAALGWQTLVFDFSTPASGTAALNSAFTYNTIIIFPDFGAATAAAGTYYVGPITFLGASAPLSAPLSAPSAGSYTVEDFNATLPSGQAYNLNDFNGDGASLTSTGVPGGAPTGTGPQVVQIVTPALTGGAVYNGTFMGVGYENSVGALPFYAAGGTTPQATKLSMVVYSPVAGADIKMKLQNASNSNQSVETDVTAAQGWQTLVFDFSAPATGTAALNPAFTYNSIIIFPNFGATTGASATYYVGPVTFLGEGAPLAPPLATPVVSGGKPTVAAPTPSLASSKVKSLYNSSGVYSNVLTPDSWFETGWGAQTVFSTYAVTGASTVLEYAGLDYAGVQFPASFPAANLLNVSAMTFMHVDVWTSGATQFGVQLVSFAGGNSPDSGAAQVNYDSTVIKNGQWIALEIPMAQFTTAANIVGGTLAGMDLTEIGQILWLDNMNGSTEHGTFYIDNVYFHD